MKYKQPPFLLWISFASAMSIYLVMLIYTLPEILTYTDGLAAFDMRPMGYSHNDALALLGALGEDGRKFYISRQLVLDLFYPGLLGVFMWLSFAGLAPKTSSRWMGFVSSLKYLTPFVALFDYAENFTIFLMLTGSELSAGLVQASSLLTVSKSMISLLLFSLLLATAVHVGSKWLLKHSRQK